MATAKIKHADDTELPDVEGGHFAACHDEPLSNPAGTSCPSFMSIPLLQKLLAEAIGTFFIMFIGFAAIVVDKTQGEVITFPGICVTWGLIVMVMIYSLGHISGAHFNPAVTITFAVLRGFPWKEVPFYVSAQLVGSLLASSSLNSVSDVTPKAFFGTVSSVSPTQALATEILISFVLMFVIFCTALDERAYNQIAGVVIAMTIIVNSIVAGKITGASMNPVRSIGPAIVKHTYKDIWVYVTGPILGCLAGGITYDLIVHMDRWPFQLTKCISFLTNLRNRDGSSALPSRAILRQGWLAATLFLSLHGL